MWQVNLGTSILYYPANDDFAIFDTNLNEEVGLAGEFTFKVPPTNPLYGSLANGALITILKDGEEFWRGEISDMTTDFQKVVEVYCVEDLSWLMDEYMTPAKITNETYAQRFQAAISAYNQNRTADRKFTAGYITARTASATCNWTTEYEWSILDCLRNCICGDDGYVRVRRVTNGGTVTRYIDIVKLSDYGVAASQPIQYGYNLLDYVKESDYGNLTNVLTPYGAEIEDQEVYTDYPKRVQGTTISDSTSINLYGRHAKSVVFDDVSNVSSLNSLARAYLTRYSQPQLTLEVKAVDLAEIENVDDIRVGDSVQVIAEPFGINQRLYLTQIQRDLQDISKNTITLSGYVSKGRTLTSQNLALAELVEDIPSRSSILDAAKKNALMMLLDETQAGYVVFEYDSTNTKMTAINICNAQTIERSTKRWRWSQNGFGYMYRANINTAWTGPNVAMTMDGSIVANFITTGTMSGDRIATNTLNANRIVSNSITSSQIAAGAIISSRIQAGAITADKISSGAVTAAKIAANAVTTDKLSANAVTAAKVAASAITADKISSGAVTAAKISANAVTSDKIAASAVTAGKISVTSLAAINANLGSVNVGGNNNTSGVLTVKDASGTTRVTLDRYGIVSNGTHGTQTKIDGGKLEVTTAGNHEQYLTVYEGNTSSGIEVYIGGERIAIRNQSEGLYASFKWSDIARFLINSGVPYQS